MEAFVNGIISALSVETEVNVLKKQLREQEQQILDLLHREEELHLKCDCLVKEKIQSISRMEVAEKKLVDCLSRVKDLEECEVDAIAYIRELESQNDDLLKELKRANNHAVYFKDMVEQKEREITAALNREDLIRARCVELERPLQKMQQPRNGRILIQSQTQMELEDGEKVDQYKARVREVGKKLYATETKLTLVTEQLNLVEKENSELKGKTGYLSEFAMNDRLVGFSTFF